MFDNSSKSPQPIGNNPPINKPIPNIPPTSNSNFSMPKMSPNSINYSQANQATQVPIQPQQPPINPQPVNRPVAATPPTMPPVAPPISRVSLGSIPMTERNILTDEEQKEMLRRDKLSRLQKIVLIIIALIVLGSLIGGGVWLYLTIKPFSDNSNSTNTNINSAILNKNSNPNSIINANINTDTDNDGLTDIEESQYATLPNNPDTDGDGFTDGEEVKGGYNPLGEGKLLP